jgi:hypothetical protein
MISACLRGDGSSLIGDADVCPAVKLADDLVVTNAEAMTALTTWSGS